LVTSDKSSHQGLADAAGDREKLGRDMPWLLHNAGIRGNERLLDLGVGAGPASFVLAPFVDSVVVAQGTNAELIRTQELFGRVAARLAQFVSGTPEQLPFDDASFDIVTSRVSGHHFDDAQRAFREIRRVLGPCGHLMFMDVISWGNPATAAFQEDVEKLRDPSHRRMLMRSEWTTLTRNAGLRVEDDAVKYRAHDMESWLEEAGNDNLRKQQLRDRFVNAPDAARHQLRILIEDGMVRSFTDREVILKARAVSPDTNQRSASGRVTWSDYSPLWARRSTRSVMVKRPQDDDISKFHAHVSAKSGFQRTGEVIVVAQNPCEDRLTVGAQLDLYDESPVGNDYSSPIGHFEVLLIDPEGAPRLRI
jgi:ubiquinone/menaquinone biosynthesis C-methylase UbiE